MEPLTREMLSAVARERGLDLTTAELDGLLPLVQAGRALMAAVEEPDLPVVEPASQYRML